MTVNRFTLKRIILYLIPLLIIVLGVINIETIFSIQLDDITDRKNYHDNVIDGEILFENAINSNFPVIFFTESLFKFVYFIFSKLGLSPEYAIKIVILISIILFFRVLFSFRGLNIWEILLIFFCPTVIVNFIMTIRQGFALSIFLFIFFQVKNKRLINLIPLIHFAYFIVLPVFYLSNYIKKRTEINPILWLSLFLFFCVSLSIFILKITNSLNLFYFDAFQDNVQFKFGFGIIFWFFILLLFVLEGKYFLNKYMFESMIVIFYIGTVAFFNPFSRILQASSVFVLLAGFTLTGWRRQMFIIILVLFDFYLIVPMIINKSLGSMSLSN